MGTDKPVDILLGCCLYYTITLPRGNLFTALAVDVLLSGISCLAPESGKAEAQLVDVASRPITTLLPGAAWPTRQSN